CRRPPEPAPSARARVRDLGEPLVRESLEDEGDGVKIEPAEPESVLEVGRREPLVVELEQDPRAQLSKGRAMAHGCSLSRAASSMTSCALWILLPVRCESDCAATSASASVGVTCSGR